VVDGIPRSYLSKARLLLKDESKNLSLLKSFNIRSAAEEVDVTPAPNAEGYPDPTKPVPVDPEA